MLKTVVLLNNIFGNMMHFFLYIYIYIYIYKIQENIIHLKLIFCNIVNLFTVTFDHFNRFFVK